MNKKERIKQLKNKNGITLIALVVTIIVLIILAGVSINLVLGDNGIITKAKEAKQNTELAQIEEQVEINETVEYLENLGTGTPPEEIKTVEEMRTAGTYMPEKTTLKDSNDNLIEVPEGFKIAEDSGINVTEGIVIEDNDIIEGVGNGRGNQYVWIPVGENIKKSDGTEIDITLGRYDFADGTNDKDAEGNTLAKGTPILVQNISDYTNQTDDIKISTYFYEDITQRAGVASSDTNALNATALSILNFKTSVNNNKGYYIARYEASYGVDGKANSKVSIGEPGNPTKTEGMLWNCISQINATVASRGLYEKTTTDLINSYAWDTAIVYIQAFSEESDYSYEISKNTVLANTGVNGDEVCKINDMASNTPEYTTEYSTYIHEANAGNFAYSSVYRSGGRNSSLGTALRGPVYPGEAYGGQTFRTILYM